MPNRALKRKDYEILLDWKKNEFDPRAKIADQQFSESYTKVAVKK